MRFSSGRTRSGSQPGISCGVSSTTLTSAAQRIVDTGHFQADDAAADHQHAARRLRQFQRAVESMMRGSLGQARQLHGFGAGRDDAVIEADALAALRSVTSMTCGLTKLAGARDHLDLALLGQQPTDRWSVS